MSGLLTRHESCPVCEAPASPWHRHAHVAAWRVTHLGHALRTRGEPLLPSSRSPRRDVGQSVKGLRRRRPKDVAACARLLRVVHGEDGYPARWLEPPRAWLEADDVLDAWVVERQGEILGHVAVSTVGNGEVSAFRWREMTGQDPAELAGVTRLFVRPRVRGQGIGRALMDAATDEILARGLSPVADVVAASRETMRLYEDHGWQLLAMDPWRERPTDLRVWCYRLPPRLGRRDG